MPAFSLQVTPPPVLTPGRKKLQLQAKVAERLNELDDEESEQQAEYDHLEEEAMAILKKFLPLPGHLEAACEAADKRLEHTKSQKARFQNIEKRLRGEPGTTEDDDLLESLGFGGESEQPVGNGAAVQRSAMQERADGRERGELMGMSLRDMKKHMGLAPKKGNSSMFDQERMSALKSGMGRDVEMNDDDEDSEVSRSYIGADLLDEDGEPRRRAESGSTGSYVSGFQAWKAEGEATQQDLLSPERALGGQRKHTQAQYGSRQSKSPSASSTASSQQESIAAKVRDMVTSPATTPKAKGPRLGAGPLRKAQPESQPRKDSTRQDSPRLPTSTLRRSSLDEELFGRSQSEGPPSSPAEEPTASTQEQLESDDEADVSRASSESSDGLFVSERTPWVYEPRESHEDAGRGASRKRRYSSVSASPSSSGKSTHKPDSLPAATTGTAPSVSHKKSPVTCGPRAAPASRSAFTSLSASTPTLVNALSDSDDSDEDSEDLPFGDEVSTWNFDTLDQTQAHAQEPSLNPPTPSNNRATATSSPLRSALRKSRHPQKSKKSVRFDDTRDGLLFPTPGGKSFQLIGQQAKGPLLPTPEQAQGDWTFFKQMSSNTKRKGSSDGEEEKVEDSLQAFTSKKGKKTAKKSKSASIVEAGDVDDPEPEFGDEESLTMNESTPKSKKKADKWTTNEKDWFNKTKDKVKKPETKSKKKPTMTKEQLADIIKNGILNGTSKKAGKRNTSGFFGPGQ